MKKLLKTLKTALKYVTSRFPTKLPVGATAFEKWADDIIELSGQFADKDSMRYAIASILIHSDSKFGALPKKYFVDRLRKSAANQVASQVFQEIKLKQEAAQKAAQQTKVEGSAPVNEAQSSDVKI